MSIASALADALRSQESGGGSDPDLRNATGSGARGPWQIMPANWPSWARSAGLSSDAPWTLANQQRVVINQIQRHLDAGYSPEDIAAIWYSGQPVGSNADAPQEGGPSIRDYVNSVMSKLPGAGRTETGSDTAVATPASSGTDTAPPISDIFTGPLANLIKGLKNRPVAGTKTTPSTPVPGSGPYQRTGNYDTDALAYANTMLETKGKIDDWIQQHTGELDAAGDPVGYVFDPKTGLVESVKSNGYDAATGPKYIYTPIAEPSILGSKYKNAQDNLTLLENLKTKGLVVSGIDSAKAYIASDKEHGQEATRQLNDFIDRVKNLVSMENIPEARAKTLSQTLADVSKSQADAGGLGYSAVAPKIAPYTDLSGAIKSLAGTIGQAPQPYSVPASDFAHQIPHGGTPVGKPQDVLAKYGLAPPNDIGLASGGTGQSDYGGNIGLATGGTGLSDYGGGLAPRYPEEEKVM